MRLSVDSADMRKFNSIRNAVFFGELEKTFKPRKVEFPIAVFIALGADKIVCRGNPLRQNHVLTVFAHVLNVSFEQSPVLFAHVFDVVVFCEIAAAPPVSHIKGTRVRQFKRKDRE